VLGLWLLLAVLMSANGVFRELVLRPRLDDASADMASAAIGIVVILGATRALLGTALAGASGAQLAQVSAALVVATVAFECVVGRTVDHRSWTELAGNYAFWRGRLWTWVLLALALSPFLWGRWLTAGRAIVRG
jgi:hypothetical protein